MRCKSIEYTEGNIAYQCEKEAYHEGTHEASKGNGGVIAWMDIILPSEDRGEVHEV